jgi:exosortase
LNLGKKQIDTRWIYLLIWCLACMALFWRSLLRLWNIGLSDENVSHVFLIPLISIWLLFVEKKEMPQGVQADRTAFLFLIPGFLLMGVSSYTNSAVSGPLTLPILSLLFLVVAGFVFWFGRAGAGNQWFPLAFLLFAVPLPSFLLDRFIYWLQAGSASVAEFFFELSGFPVMREGFVFRLPRISIEVAQECSGIRSSIALLILAVLVSHFSFRPVWKKLLFVAAGLLMMLIKNGIRIATLTLLANYVNPDFLYGKLHHRGGIVFFLIGLALLIPVYQLLRRGEGPSTLTRVVEPV